MDAQILTTKLYIPPARSDQVPRPRLFRRLDDGVQQGRKLTLVAAPAGYGKTSLVSDGPLMAAIQAIIPEDQQARAFTVIMSGANLATPLGMAIGRPVADRFGVHVLYVLSGIACLATAAAGLMTPAVMHLEAAHEGAASPDETRGTQLGAAAGG